LLARASTASFNSDNPVVFTANLKWLISSTCAAQCTNSSFINDSALVISQGGIVVPMFEPYALALERSGLSPSPLVAAPPLPVFRAFEGATSGKAQQREWLRQHGFEKNAITEYPTPDVVSRFPVILKPTKGHGGRGVQIIDNATALRHAVGAFFRTNQAFVLQEAVAGQHESGVYFAAFRGELLQADCLRYTFSEDLYVRTGTNGPGLIAVRDESCDAAPFKTRDLRRLVAASRYHGFGCLGIKARGAGRPAAFIELNTRICASHIFRLTASFMGALRRFSARARSRNR